jgi:SAM-dependent methyltransferase
MWDERYQDADYVYGTKPNEFLASIELTPGIRRKVLCLAEGEGRNAIYMAKHGFDVLAVDQSMVGLQKALKLAIAEGTSIRVEKADLKDYTISENYYDGIVSIFGHLPAEIKKKVNKKIISGIKKGGFLIIEAYSKKQIQYTTGGPKDITMLDDLDELLLDFSDHLDYKIKRVIERVVLEGKFHTGKASVIQIFAIKK